MLAALGVSWWAVTAQYCDSQWNHGMHSEGQWWPTTGTDTTDLHSVALSTQHNVGIASFFGVLPHQPLHCAGYSMATLPMHAKQVAKHAATTTQKPQAVWLCEPVYHTPRIYGSPMSAWRLHRSVTG